MKANLCKRLSIEFQLPEMNYDVSATYDQPTEYGLCNCNMIIPEYYKRPPDKILEVDYFTMIKDDIRNMRVLNEYQLKYIMELDDIHKEQILKEYNNVVKAIGSLMNI
jgi:hypothetical protein